MYKFQLTAMVLIAGVTACGSGNNTESAQEDNIIELSNTDTDITDEVLDTDDNEQVIDNDSDSSDPQLGLPQISSELYRNVLSEVFSLINFEPMKNTINESVLDINTLRTSVTSIPGITDPGLDLMPLENPTDAWSHFQDYSCDAGGSILLLYPSDRYTSELGTVFNDCTLSDGVYNGLSRFRSPTIHATGSNHKLENYRFNDFDGNGYEISGTYSSSSSIYGSSAQAGWNQLNFTKEVNGNVLKVEDYSSNYGMQDSTMQGSSIVFIQYHRPVSFTYTSAGSQNKPITVSSDLRAGRYGPSPDTSGELWWSQGSITVNASDGTSLVMTPVAGNRGIWNVQLNAEFSSQFNMEWNEPIECFGMNNITSYEHAELCD